MTATDENNVNGRYAKLILGEDFVFAVSASVAAFHFLSIFVIFIPLITLSTSLLFRRRLPPDVRQPLRALYKLPRSLILRQSERDDCYVVSALGLSVLMLSQQVLANPDSADARLIIAHELGHLGRADKVMAEMLTMSAIFGLMAIRYGVVLHATGSLGFADLAAAYGLLAAYAAVFGIGASRLRHFYHTREFLADSRAMATEPEQYGQFLRSRELRERYIKPRFRILAWANKMSHPTFAERWRFQSEPHHASGPESFTSGALTAWVAIVSVGLSFTGYASLLHLGAWGVLSDEHVQEYLLLAAKAAPFVGTAWAIGATVCLLKLVWHARAIDGGGLRILGYAAGSVIGLAMWIAGWAILGGDVL